MSSYLRVFYNDAELQLNKIDYPDPRFTEQFAIPGADWNNNDGIDETSARQTLVFNRANIFNPFPEQRTLISQLTFTTLTEFDGTQLSASIAAYQNSLETITLSKKTGVDHISDGTDELLFGGRGDDFFDTSAAGGGNRLYGRSGDDTFILGNEDRAIGGRGDDQFFFTGGDNLVTGGRGVDQFWIANPQSDEGANIITDFDLEDDLLNIEGLGVGGFNELTLSNEDGNALISFGGNELVKLLRVDADSLVADNFVF